MKIIIGISLILLTSCQVTQEKTVVTHDEHVESTEKPEVTEQSNNEADSLFVLNEEISENSVKIIPPKNSDFELPDTSVKTEAYKKGDFNADGKEDILVYLGACGTGGCMYGLFLKQHENFYSLAFMGYLKNTEFNKEENGLWTIKSAEELDPYDPSKMRVTIFKLDTNINEYEMDTTFIHYD